ncbi:hypothetical protein OROMI_000652 [Orobanche minor]
MATIAFESKRAHTVRQAHDRVDPDVLAESELRHHKVLSIRSDIDLGNTNAEIVKQMAKLNENFEKLRKEIKDDIQDLKLELGAKSDATIARTFNQMDLEGKGKLLMIPKYIPGHPEFYPPTPFFATNQYLVGSLPPEGLIPKTYDQMLSCKDLNRYENIHWFYNDSRLRVDGKDVDACLNSLMDFMS